MTIHADYDYKNDFGRKTISCVTVLYKQLVEKIYASEIFFQVSYFLCFDCKFVHFFFLTDLLIRKRDLLIGELSVLFAIWSQSFTIRKKSINLRSIVFQKLKLILISNFFEIRIFSPSSICLKKSKSHLNC